MRLIENITDQIESLKKGIVKQNNVAKSTSYVSFPIRVPKDK